MFRPALYQCQLANFSIVQEQQRFFAKKKKFGKSKSGEESGAASEVEPEDAAQEEPAHHAAPVVDFVQQKSSKLDWSAAANRDSLDAPNLDAKYYQPFSVGDVKRVGSAPYHKPPSFEDTIEGRYAASLFISASQSGKLYEVYEDMVYLNHLYKNCEHFRLFTENSGIGLAQVKQLNQALAETAHFDDVTFKFLIVLAESKRLIYLDEISKKFAKLYTQLNKEEKITIISASELSSHQKDQVLDALRANPKNEGKQFVI
jgi:ATP synthase F1 delta subunit